MSIREASANRPSLSSFAAETDWSAEWRERLERSGLEANLERVGLTQEEFWERFGSWMDTLRKTGHPGVLLDRVLEHVREGDSVLDIGAGSGAFALPLAQRVHCVTAVEPSPAQSSRLESSIRECGITNLRVIRTLWEEVDVTGIGRHDIVLAVHSLQMPDIREALRRMVAASKRLVILVHPVEHDLMNALRSLGVETGPNYLYLHNTMVQMGLRPRMEFVTRTFRVPLAQQLNMLRCNPGLDDSLCERLRERLESEGRVFILDDEPHVARWRRDAVMYLDTSEAERRDA